MDSGDIKENILCVPTWVNESDLSMWTVRKYIELNCTNKGVSLLLEMIAQFYRFYLAEIKKSSSQRQKSKNIMTLPKLIEEFIYDPIFFNESTPEYVEAEIYLSICRFFEASDHGVINNLIVEGLFSGMKNAKSSTLSRDNKIYFIQNLLSVALSYHSPKLVESICYNFLDEFWFRCLKTSSDDSKGRIETNFSLLSVVKRLFTEMCTTLPVGYNIFCVLPETCPKFSFLVFHVIIDGYVKSFFTEKFKSKISILDRKRRRDHPMDISEHTISNIDETSTYSSSFSVLSNKNSKEVEDYDRFSTQAIQFQNNDVMKHENQFLERNKNWKMHLGKFIDLTRDQRTGNSQNLNISQKSIMGDKLTDRQDNVGLRDKFHVITPMASYHLNIIFYWLTNYKSVITGCMYPPFLHLPQITDPKISLKNHQNVVKISSSFMNLISLCILSPLWKNYKSVKHMVDSIHLFMIDYIYHYMNSELTTIASECTKKEPKINESSPEEGEMRDESSIEDGEIDQDDEDEKITNYEFRQTLKDMSIYTHTEKEVNIVQIFHGNADRFKKQNVTNIEDHHWVHQIQLLLRLRKSLKTNPNLQLSMQRFSELFYAYCKVNTGIKNLESLIERAKPLLPHPFLEKVLKEISSKLKKK